MSDRAHRKEMLRQQISSDRQLLSLEVENLKNRWDSTTRMLRMGADLAKPLGAVAALAATVVGRGVAGAGAKAASAGGKVAGAGGRRVAKAGAGGLVGLAALIPVAVTIARVVASMREKGGDQEPAEATGDATES